MLHLIGLALAIGFGIWFGLAAFARGEERRADRLERRRLAQLDLEQDREEKAPRVWPVGLSVVTAIAIIVMINVAHS